MIYKIICNANDASTLLLINNSEKLSSYINTLLRGLDESNLAKDDPNVNAQITSITKNIPIQLDINSIH
nr:MAG TPA: hypothetical protein [Crassvirales sp.]